ncbi:MAG: aminopeptidase, partial [Polyangiaceae bacterium]
MAIEQRLHARCGCAIAHAAGETQESGLRPFALATSIRHFERDRPFAVEHLALDLALDLPKKSVAGTATLTLKRIDAEATEIVLDAIGFEITSVTVGGKDAKYVYDGRTLAVAIPPGTDDGILAVTYAATPRRGLYFLEPDAHVPERPRQVWSQCQEEDARHWIPCHDKPHVKMTTEMRIRVPNGFYVLSNGELVEKKTPAEGSWQFHWKMPAPHPSYLLTLVAGEFEELTAKAGEVPLQYLVPKGRRKDGERTFARTPEMIRYFSEKT